jgi:hypothetical protein
VHFLCAASVFSVSPWLTWPKNTIETQRPQRLHRDSIQLFGISENLEDLIDR